MKEFVQLAGVRRWHGSELIELQQSVIGPLQSHLSEYGAFILYGCDISANGSNWDISAGIVAIDHADGFKIAEFAGVTNQALPGYLSIDKSAAQKEYDDLLTKDASYIYTAIFTAGSAPDGSALYLPIADQYNPQLADVPRRLTDALGLSATDESVTITGTTGLVTSNSLKLTLNRVSRQVHISGNATIGNYNSLTGNDTAIALAAPANVPFKYRPVTRQYFLAYVQDPGSGTPANFYVKDANNTDYSRVHVGWIDTNGTITIRFMRPSSGTSQILELRGIISLV